MSYGFDDKTKDTESGSKFLKAGIQEGIFLKEVKFNPAKDNVAASLEITCTNKEGQTVARKYFEPRIDGKIIKDEAGINQAISKFSKVVANLTRKFLGENYSIANQPNFESFCKKTIEDLYTKKSLFDTTELRTKVVLNTSGYPTLPGYAPIWEVVSKVPAAESKLVINERFDVVDQPKTNKESGQQDLGLPEDPFINTDNQVF